MITLLFSLLLALGFGYLCAELLTPRDERPLVDAALKLGLALPLGAGAASITFFAGLALTGWSGAGILLLGGASLALALLRWRRGAAGPEPVRAPAASLWPSLGGLALAAVLVYAIAAGFRNFNMFLSLEPFGEMDAWTIWNLRALFLYRGGSGWAEAFDPVFFHADYPVLLPGFIAWLMTAFGEDARWIYTVPAWLGTFGCLGLLVLGLWRLRSFKQGALAALVLSGATIFAMKGAIHYADIPLALFFLAAIIARSLASAGPELDRRALALAGLLAGMAAWTKNEGQPFFLILGATAVAGPLWRRRWSDALRSGLAYGLGGAAPVLVLVLFKLTLAPDNDLTSAQGLEETLKRLLDPQRYATIAGYLGEQAASFGFWELGRRKEPLAIPLMAIIAGASLLLGLRREERRVSLAGWASLSLLMATYLIVYLLTPFGIRTHMGTSFDRLVLQLLPSLLFVLFLSLRTPEELWGEGLKLDEGAAYTLPRVWALIRSKGAGLAFVAPRWRAITALLRVALAVGLLAFLASKSLRHRTKVLKNKTRIRRWLARQGYPHWMFRKLDIYAALRAALPSRGPVGYIDGREATIDGRWADETIGEFGYLCFRFVPVILIRSIKPDTLVVNAREKDVAPEDPRLKGFELQRDLENGFRIYRRVE